MNNNVSFFKKPNNILRRPFRDSINYNFTYWLIGINLVIFVLATFVGSKIGVFLNVGFIRYQMTLSDALAMIPFAVKQGWVWSFVTYMFMHADIGHVFFNMLGLYFFGIQVEKQMGSKEFLLYYLLTGILAGIFSFVIFHFTGNDRAALVGASGALYAVLLSFAVYNPNSVVYVMGIIPLRAPVMVLAYTVLSLFFILTGGGGNVAHLTHLAGFGFGWLYFMVRFGVNPWKRLTGRY